MRRGRAVQADPFKSTLKAPGIKRLKLEYGELLSSFAFKYNLRWYTVVGDNRDDRCADSNGAGKTTLVG